MVTSGSAVIADVALLMDVEAVKSLRQSAYSSVHLHRAVYLFLNKFDVPHKLIPLVQGRNGFPLLKHAPYY